MDRTSKPRLSFWQIWNMSFGFFGIQFGWGLQMANMSAIYLYLGAEEKDIAGLWLAAPLTGLIVQPIIGYMSDRTWGGFGRRRPYFLIGAILASIALIFMPSSGTVWMAAGLLWILDASVNVSMEPFRAFVGDMLPNEQRKSGFAMQSVLIGAGAVLSSMLPFILTRGFGVSGEATATSAIPDSVKWAFHIGAAVFFAAVLYTVLTTKEYPPEDLAAFEAHKRETAGIGNAFREIFQGIGSMPGPMRKLASVQFFTWFALFCMWLYFTSSVAKGIFKGTPLGVHEAAANEALDAPENAGLLAAAASAAERYSAIRENIARQQEAEKSGPLKMLASAVGLASPPPDPAEKITGAQLTEALAAGLASPKPQLDDKEKHNPMLRTIASLYAEGGMAPGAAPAEAALSSAAKNFADRLAGARRFQEGAAWGGVCFAVYNLVSFGFAFGLLGLVKFLSARNIHLICLICGGLGLLSTVFVTQPSMLLLCMVGVGIAWASILAMPYAMLSNALPPAKMGFYMGVFNFFIVLPQILASLGLGRIVGAFFGGDASKVVMLGGISMLLAAVMTLRIHPAETE